MGIDEDAISLVLADIRYYLENPDTDKLLQTCETLKSLVEKYPAGPSILSRLKAISSMSEPSGYDFLLNNPVKEIDDLISLLKTL